MTCAIRLSGQASERGARGEDRRVEGRRKTLERVRLVGLLRADRVLQVRLLELRLLHDRLGLRLLDRLLSSGLHELLGRSLLLHDRLRSLLGLLHDRSRLLGLLHERLRLLSGNTRSSNRSLGVLSRLDRLRSRSGLSRLHGVSARRRGVLLLLEQQGAEAGPRAARGESRRAVLVVSDLESERSDTVAVTRAVDVGCVVEAVVVALLAVLALL